MKEHGRYQIELQDRVVIVRFFDAWNEETSRRMCAEFLQVASTIADKPWACLVDLVHWGLGGPEVMAPIIEVNNWCTENNQAMEAVVCTVKLQEVLLRELQKALPKTESQFFETESEARAWLRDAGYRV
ncbi:hypothetical protein ACFSJ3_04070 [Corallincola platygyrae]|uniref:STAS/SEC14 domain-containing protein n=1 Tax=Corallincola platygyrae TaxID=1193278 RepID=A0ABW4XMB4_9GAMM